MTKQSAKKTKELFACPHCGTKYPIEKLLEHIDTSPCGKYLREQLGREFTKEVKFNEPTTAAQQTARQAALVMISKNNGRCVLRLRETEGTVVFISQLESGVLVDRMARQQFEAIYRGVPDYPTPRCARMLVEFSQHIGASTEALSELASLVDVTQAEVEKASERIAANKSTRVATKVVMTAGGSVSIDVKPRTRKDSAASMFRGLIMEGALTDDQIFQKVQSVFGLDDDKRTHVAYYRSQLKKQGKNPPDKLKTPTEGSINKVTGQPAAESKPTKETTPKTKPAKKVRRSKKKGRSKLTRRVAKKGK